MQEQISAAAADKRKRGRPAIDVSMTSWLNGTHRTHVNAMYMEHELESRELRRNYERNYDR